MALAPMPMASLPTAVASTATAHVHSTPVHGTVHRPSAVRPAKNGGLNPPFAYIIRAFPPLHVQLELSAPMPAQPRLDLAPARGARRQLDAAEAIWHSCGLVV